SIRQLLLSRALRLFRLDKLGQANTDKVQGNDWYSNGYLFNRAYVRYYCRCRKKSEHYGIAPPFEIASRRNHAELGRSHHDDRQFKQYSGPEYQAYDEINIQADSDMRIGLILAEVEDEIQRTRNYEVVRKYDAK